MHLFKKQHPNSRITCTFGVFQQKIIKNGSIHRFWKEEYQERAKDTLKRLVSEKLEAVKKLQEVEKILGTTEDEYATLRELYDKNMDENKKLAAEINRLNTDLEATRAKIPPEPAEAAKLPLIEDKSGDFYIKGG